MNTQMVKYSLLLLTLLLSISLCSASFASSLETGAYVVYSYSVDFGERSVTGILREEVVSNYGNGTIRLRLEATFNDGVATLELKTTERAFKVPRLAMLPEGQFTYSNQNYSISFSLTRVETSQVSLAGRSYLVNVYAVSGLATFTHSQPSGAGEQSTQIQFSGRLTQVNGSGVIYSAEGQVTGPNGGVAEFVIQLIDTNLDLSSIPAPSDSLTSSAMDVAPMIGLFSAEGLGLEAPRAALSSPTAERETTDSDTSEYSSKALAIVVAGLAALAIVAAIPLKSKRQKTQEDLARKPHYV